MLLNLQSHFVVHSAPAAPLVATTTGAHMKERQPLRPVNAVSHSVRHFVPFASTHVVFSASGLPTHRERGEGR